MTDYFDIGEIINTHGIKGEVRAKSLTDFAEERFEAGQDVFLAKDDLPLQSLTITRYRRHKKFHLLTFEGYDNINQVLDFIGARLQIAEEDLQDLDQESFYVHEIIGLDIVDEEGRELGRVKEVQSSAANDIWVVDRPGKKDLYLPFIKSVVLDINLPDRQARVHVLEGLDPDEN